MVNKKLDLNTNYKENKAIKIGIWVFTIVVFALVGVMGSLPKPEVAPSFTKALPAVNAIINVTCFLCLVTSFIMIKKKNIKNQKNKIQYRQPQSTLLSNQFDSKPSLFQRI